MLDITNCEWWRHFTFSFSFKLVVITNYNCTYNVKPFCNWTCDYKSFLPRVTKDSLNNNHKNGWFGHKLQTHGLVWTRFHVVFAFNLETWTRWLSETMKHYMVFPLFINQIWWWLVDATFSNDKIIYILYYKSIQTYHSKAKHEVLKCDFGWN